MNEKASDSAVSCRSTYSKAKPSFQQQRAQNENSITVNIQSERVSRDHETCNDLRTGQISLSPQPLRLDIQNGTDWPTVLVGIAGVISSIIIARYTSRMQQNQINSNIANLRQRWIEDLRECSSSFMEKMTYILNEKIRDPDYLDSKDSTDPFSKMLSAQIKFSLMLDVQHENNSRAIKVSEEIINEIKALPDKEAAKNIERLGHEFESLVREILEAAWQNIKSDLLARRWYNFTR